MPYTMDDFQVDYRKEHFKDMGIVGQLLFLGASKPTVRRRIFAAMPLANRRKLQKAIRTGKFRKMVEELFAE